MSTGLVSSEASLLGLQMANFSLCLHMIFLLCVCVLISSYKETSQIELGPTCKTSFSLNYLFKGPISKYTHILRY